MSWRDVLGATALKPEPYSHNSHNSQKPQPKGNCANTANSANSVPVSTAPPKVRPTVTLRAHLLALAEAEGMDAELVHALGEADLTACAGLPDAALRAYLTALSDTADREAGRIPTGWTAKALCRHCGPVWLHPDVAAVLPVVAGWPRALGCPWCCVTRHANMTLPRPPITCAECRHYQPDPLNRDAGMSCCACGDHYPNERHQCDHFTPREQS